MHIWLYSTVHSVYEAGNDILRVICCSCFVPSSIYVFPSLSSPLSARSSTPAIFFFLIYPFFLFLLSNATFPGFAVHFFPIKWYCFPNSQISWREPLFQIFGKSWDFVGVKDLPPIYDSSSRDILNFAQSICSWGETLSFSN